MHAARLTARSARDFASAAVVAVVGATCPGARALHGFSLPSLSVSRSMGLETRVDRIVSASIGSATVTNSNCTCQGTRQA